MKIQKGTAYSNNKKNFRAWKGIITFFRGKEKFQQQKKLPLIIFAFPKMPFDALRPRPTKMLFEKKNISCELDIKKTQVPQNSWKLLFLKPGTKILFLNLKIRDSEKMKLPFFKSDRHTVIRLAPSRIQSRKSPSERHVCRSRRIAKIERLNPGT